MTRVVNFYKEPFDVYIGRAGKGFDGYFGNPCKVGVDCPVCKNIHKEGSETLPCYERYLYSRLASDEVFRERVRSLQGKTLACFCKPKPCHGDVLVVAVEMLQKPWMDILHIQENMQYVVPSPKLLVLGSHLYAKPYNGEVTVCFSFTRQEGSRKCGPNLFYRVCT